MSEAPDRSQASGIAAASCSAKRSSDRPRDLLLKGLTVGPRGLLFIWLGWWTYRHIRRIVAGSAIIMVLTAIIGFRVVPRLGGEGFNGPASGFGQVAQILEQQFGSPDSDASIQAGSALAGVRGRILRSSDSRGGLIPVTFDPSAEISPREIADAVKQSLGEQGFRSTAVHIGGGAVIPKAINTRSAKIWGTDG